MEGRTRFKVAAVGLSLLLSAVLGEIALRTVMTHRYTKGVYQRSRAIFQYDSRNIVHDEDLGYRVRPGLRTRFSNWEFSTQVTTNSLGLRDDEESLSGARILVLGDSFGFGWGVEEDETLESWLERLAGTTGLNMGVSGYGTLQQYLLLRRYARQHDVRGRMAIFLYFQNDWGENVGYGFGVYPTITSDDDPPRFTRTRSEDLEAYLVRTNGEMNRGPFRVSFAADLLRRCVRKLARILSEVGRDPQTEDEPESNSPLSRKLVMQRVVEQIASFSRDRGLYVAFAHIPVVPPLDEEEKAQELLSDLQGILEEAEIDLIDLRPALSREDYFEFDDHWRTSGHRKAAGAILAHLVSRGLVPASAPAQGTGAPDPAVVEPDGAGRS